MARITVEDCAEIEPNRFKLVLLAAERAKNIGAGSPLLVERDNDKNSVVALKEIAKHKLSVELLNELLIKRNQHMLNTDPGAMGLEEDQNLVDSLHEELSNYETDESLDGFDGVSFDDEIEISDEE